MITLTAEAEEWPIDGTFTISRGARTHAHVVKVTLSRNGVTGTGECVPYPRYGESVEGVLTDIRGLEEDFRSGLDRDALQFRLPAGAARNAVDCALWDLEAKETGRSVAEIIGFAPLAPIETAYTISLGDADTMAAAARKHSGRPLLKVKLGGDGDGDRIKAVRSEAPSSRLIIDANEAWNAENFDQNMAACVEARVDLIEQPLPEGEDGILARMRRPIPVCADESAHTSDGIEDISDRYDAINIKLDKTGGLTEALRLLTAGRQTGFKIMTGCMLGTSLAMAPAFLLCTRSDYCDIDGPLLLAADRDTPLKFDADSRVFPPASALWG